MEGLFTSESVSERHPDKVADRIADAVLDAVLENNPKARVACDVLIKNKLIVLAGELSTPLPENLDAVIQKIVYGNYKIIQAISTQSPDIAHGIDHASPLDQGAGDQGMVFGYACTDTPELMPAPILYAHRLMQKQAEVRKNGTLNWLKPDAKCQITFRYENDRPKSIDNVVLSTQHDAEVDRQSLIEAVMEEIVKPVLPAEWLNRSTRFFINPAGRFVLGGPEADCGLSGKKTAVDSYGSMSRDGGGCFSGKDPSKVDRSGSYYARYIAKNIVKVGIASRCEIQVAYAIGVSEPVALHIDTFGTGLIPDAQIEALIRRHFDLRPYAIIESLHLLAPIYSLTTCYGHFGRELPEFLWERCDKTEELRTDVR
ncbi:MAG: methionine adenosyltransferase, partial [Parachlamydiaceae bacterium]